MDRSAFTSSAPGQLVPISGSDALGRPWQHVAFSPDPLPATAPELDTATWGAVTEARASLAALDATARRLPNPEIFRRPALRTEAQSTSALEGTYAPLATVLTADIDHPHSTAVREVLNYVEMANHAFDWINEGRGLTVGLLENLQQTLVRGTPSERYPTGSVRDRQVVIGRRAGVPPESAPIHAARFVPAPPGLDLRAALADLLSWINAGRRPHVDPVVAAALAHYQFETLHPFHDGNGRIGRLLIVVHLVVQGVLAEPTMTVSPWFEARRSEYYDRLLAVSTSGDWAGWIRFFATGLAASANDTLERMLRCTQVHEELRGVVNASALRSARAVQLVDFAVAQPSFTAREAAEALQSTPAAANRLIAALVGLGVLARVDPTTRPRRYVAPLLLESVMQESQPGPH